MEMEHLLFWSKYSIFHNIFKYMIFQRCPKALLWSKGLIENGAESRNQLIRIHTYLHNESSLVMELSRDIAPGSDIKPCFKIN